MLLLFLAQAIVSSPPAPPPPNRKGIFDGVADYPPEALRNHWEGTVVADLTIDVHGAVSECRIVRSSGHQVLDDATCNLIKSRATFKPATDDNGNPREDVYRTPPIVWRVR
jgi:protein TonB